MKKILVTLAALFSSQCFSAGNIQAMQGRFQVNAARCTSFRSTPAHAFISTRSTDTLLVEFLGSEAREIVVHVEDGEDMGRNGRETYVSRWTTNNSVISTRKFVKEDGKQVTEVVTLTSTTSGVTINQVIDGMEAMTCELTRKK
jgi:hypothetical protein